MTPHTLSRFVPRFASSRVIVIGDLMLDRYVWGEATRISQEAPVPVVRIRRQTQVPGGAANVVRNVLSLGSQALAAGVVGEDDDGRLLVRLLAEAGAQVEAVIGLRDRPTTIKTRVVANNQQVVRIDLEETSPIDGAVLQALESHVFETMAAGKADALVFEDYAKGLLTAEFMQRLVDEARRRGLVTALDPHPSHLFQVRGLNLLTPNRAEAFGLAGVYFRPTVHPIEKDRDLLEVGRRLRHDWEVDLLLITLGADGMALFSSDGPPLHIPTRAREVFDVSGAGDTVTASCVLALLAGASPEESAQLSNHAAGIVVGKVGTVPVPRDELLASLAGESAS